MPVLTALEPLAPQDPRSIGTFRLRARLGSGGMGRVYLGFSPGGRAVAVKVVHPELAHDELFRKRFRREVAAARRVNGAYTAPVIDAGPDDETPWLATVYVMGPSVADAVAAAGPLPPDSVMRLGGGLAEALADIHATDVVHRDLKPSNVLLAADGPRVIDFGISRAFETSALTTTGLVIGTPGFMSPEQATGDGAGPASDVFSLGAVLAFAATGRDPFGVGTAVTVLYRVVHAEPDLDGIDGPLRDLIARCLAKDPAARPTAHEVAALTQVPAHDSDGTDPAAADAGAFWPPALDGLIGRYADRAADEVPVTGDDLRPSETVTVRQATGTDQPTERARDGDVPAVAAGSPAWPSRARRPLRSRGVLVSAVAVLLAACVAAAIALLPPGGSKAGALPPVAPRTATARASAATSSAPASPAATRHEPARPSVTNSSGGEPSATESSGGGGTAAPSTLLPVSAPATAPPSPAPTVSAPPPQSYPVPVLLGTPNWNGYCEATGQGPVTLVTADYGYGWHCTKATTLGDDANAVCAWTFNQPASQTTNSITNFYDPNSWDCWAGGTEIKAPDWNGYCLAHGLGKAVLTQSNAYGWYCANSGNGLSDNAVCEWTNGASTLVVGRFEDFYDSSSWQCWV